MDFVGLALECAPQVDPSTMRRLVRVESAFNPFAIGVVGARLVRQPRTLDEAIATARSLEEKGFNFSVGLAQINRANFVAYNLDLPTAFDPCRNLSVGAQILAQCFSRAKSRAREANDQDAIRAALSCYYSGNFETGFTHGYVNRVTQERPRDTSDVQTRANDEPPPIRDDATALLF